MLCIDGYMGEVSSAQKNRLRTIIAGTNRMNELISTLLNITRLESGNMVANIKEVTQFDYWKKSQKNTRYLQPTETYI